MHVVANERAALPKQGGIAQRVAASSANMNAAASCVATNLEEPHSAEIRDAKFLLHGFAPPSPD
jgi:hypothetical protein